MAPAKKAAESKKAAKTNGTQQKEKVAGKNTKRKPLEDRNANDHAALRLRMCRSNSSKFRLLPRGELGVFIALPASGNSYLRVAHCGCTRKVLIAVFEALSAIEKDKRLIRYLKKLREGQRKEEAAGADDDNLMLECSEEEEDNSGTEDGGGSDEEEQRGSKAAYEQSSEEEEEEEKEVGMSFEEFLGGVYKEVVEANGALLPEAALEHMKVALGMRANQKMSKHEADVLLKVVSSTGRRPARAAAAAAVRAAVAEVQDNNRRLQAGLSAHAAAVPAASPAQLQASNDVQQQILSARTFMELTAAVKCVASAFASSKDASTAQADLDFAKGVAAGMDGATPSALQSAITSVQSAIFAAQLRADMGC